MEVQGVTPSRVDAVEDASIVDGNVDASGNLVLTTFGGVNKNAGSVVKPLFSWPVGSVYIGVGSTNPAVLFGGGTWERFGQGRVLVSQSDADSEFNSALEVGGAKTHTLTSAESGLVGHTHTQAAHTHVLENNATGAGPVVGSGSVLLEADANPNPAVNVYVAGGDTGGILVETAQPAINAAAAQNAAQAHNNLQPYIVVFMWVRTA